ncbi:MAG: hypothetical protein P8Y94_07835 [Acidobacteriota bacterium]
MGREFGVSCSVIRVLGTSAARAMISGKIQTTLTRSGHETKFGRAMGSEVPIALIALGALAILLIGGGSHAFAQSAVQRAGDLVARTDGGDRVILHSDGTWEYAKEAPADSAKTNSEKLDVAAEIKEHCAEEWPDDFSMRAYCQKKAVESLQELKSVLEKPPIPEGALSQVFAKCREQWRKDWAMVNYCVKKQIEGYRQIQ